jgi:hypothetical protein
MFSKRMVDHKLLIPALCFGVINTGDFSSKRAEMSISKWNLTLETTLKIPGRAGSCPTSRLQILTWAIAKADQNSILTSISR